MLNFTNETTISTFQSRQRRMGGQDARIYTANDVMDLLNDPLVTLHRYDDEDTIDTRTIRFALGVDHALKFGREGRPSATIPAHEKLTGLSCITAGNLGFKAVTVENQLEHQICVITNKSSDYWPSVMSLQYVIIALLQDPGKRFTFAAEITLRVYDKNTMLQVFTLAREELINAVTSLDYYISYANQVRTLLQGMATPVAIDGRIAEELLLSPPARKSSVSSDASTPSPQRVAKRMFSDMSVADRPVFVAGSSSSSRAPMAPKKGAGVKAALQFFHAPQAPVAAPLVLPILPAGLFARSTSAGLPPLPNFKSMPSTLVMPDLAVFDAAKKPRQL